MSKKLVIALLVLFAITLNAQVPIFSNFFSVTANSSPIVVPLGCASPCVYDWDGDGVKDLLFGQFLSGKIQFWKNYGTNAAPSFTSGSFIQAGGVDISVTSG